MRVVAGTARGVRLASVPKGVRPTANRVRESVFNSLGQFFGGGAALDLYAGTGALGIEALSRGCTRAVFVEKEHKNADVIRKNLFATRLSGFGEVVVGGAVGEARGLAEAGMVFDLIFCDPPYRIARHETGRVLPLFGTLLAEGGVAVLEADEGLEDLLRACGLEGRSRRYGGTFVTTAWRVGENG